MKSVCFVDIQELDLAIENKEKLRKFEKSFLKNF